MAYTNVWNNTIPTGAEAANTIDNIFRSVKVDISERFTDLFGSMPSFTTDPLRPYGLKFTDAQDSIISLGDVAGTPRNLLVKNKAGSTTYMTIGGDNITLSPVVSITLSGPSVSLSSTGVLTWSGRSKIQSTADGIFELSNNAISGFNRLTFGGVTNAFPALARSGTTLSVVTADGLADAPLTCLTIVANGPGTSSFGGQVNMSSVIVSSNPGGGLTANVATNSALFDSKANNVGTTVWGTESSAGGSIFSGTVAGAAVFGTTTSDSLHLATNNAVRLTIDNTGIVTIPGTLNTGPLNSGAIVSTGAISGTTITGSGAITGASVTTTGGGLISTTGFVTAEQFRSHAGTVLLATGVPQTIFTITESGSYTITTWSIDGNNGISYSIVLYNIGTGTNSVNNLITNGVTASLSGANIQLAQSLGANRNTAWSFIKVN